MAWNAVFGRLGDLNDPEDPAERVDEDWEDLDSVRSAEIEKKKKILKGQIARATAK